MNAAIPATQPAHASYSRKAARCSIAEGTRHLLWPETDAGTVILVYGEKGPRMTWAERAKAGVPAEEVSGRP